MNRVFLQMAGDPGSGKSLLARMIGRSTGAVVIDKDIIKAAALNAGIAEARAAPFAYEAMFALGRSLVEQGKSVIMDSPAYFTSIREKGAAIAACSGFGYYIIECAASREIVSKRLSLRIPLASQLSTPVVAPYARDGCAPLTEPRLTLDTSRSPEECLQEALDYIGYDAG